MVIGSSKTQLHHEREERRAYLRFPCKLNILEAENDSTLGRLSDISLGGASLRSEHAIEWFEHDLENSHELRFKISLPQNEILIRGKKVNRRVNRAGISHYGIKFINLNGETLKVLDEYLSLQHKIAGPSKVHSQSLPAFSRSNFYLASQKEEKGLDRLNNNLKHTEDLFSWIDSIVLDDELIALSKRYDQLGDRKHFIWQWGYAAARLTTFDSVYDSHDVCSTKVATIMLNGLIDDLVDKFHDQESCTAVYNLLLRGRPLDEVSKDFRLKEGKDYLVLVLDVWNYVQRRIRSYPNYKILKPILDFDYEQLFNSMRYAFLANTIYSYANLTEYFLYQPHNMNVMINGTIDLMNHRSFDLSELGKIRKVVWKAQSLARIANSLSTWSREVEERDYSNAIFAYLVENELVQQNGGNPDKFRDSLKSVTHQSECYAYLYSEWLSQYDSLKGLLNDMEFRSVDVSSYVASMPRLLVDFHLCLEGRL